MGRIIRLFALMCISLLPALVNSQPSTNKVVGYLPYWWNGLDFAPSFDKLTHVIYVNPGAPKATAPYWSAAGVDDNYFRRYRDSCHAHGGKFILEVVGGYPMPSEMATIMGSRSAAQAFVDTTCGWAKANRCDGIELDLEWPFNQAADLSRLLGMYRRKLDTWNPRGILTIATYFQHNASSVSWYQKDSVAAYCDFIMPMTYTLWQGGGTVIAGFDTPVYEPKAYGSYHGAWLSDPVLGITSYVNGGWPKSKICVGLSFEGTRFEASAINQKYSGWQFTATAASSPSTGYPSVPMSARVWDNQAKANYALSGGYVWSFHDTNSVKAILKFARDSSYGGIMVWDYPAGYDMRRGDELLSVLSREARTAVATEVDAGPPAAPVDFYLGANYPNPFNPSTTIEYGLAKPGNVMLAIYNTLGQRIAELVEGVQNSGKHKVIWDASGVPSGIYYYRLRAGDYAETRKLVVLK